MPSIIRSWYPRLTSRTGVWSEDEHDRFLAAIREFPRGPWFSIAKAVGTRSVRQVQTHAQKYYEKIMRRGRGLRKDRKTWPRVEHRIGDDVLEFCELMKQFNKTKSEPLPSTPKRSQRRSKKSSISPHNSPLRRCAAFALDGAKFKLELERCTRRMDAPRDLSLSIDADVSDLELPPFEEAIDFLIEIMET
ncbi:hypothetical protein PHYSODRAFT_519022 [Phytophthora sojae]|uniref:Uncharacterized protein n=1 Tax=Phytophthora sojae (strain P6497) TaxID=1094619 RepID=G5A039_PHYSP|nr:hypothetical protein PHYSODRAFT_519022 [Phytophthora sojae]EGZ11282.1 hypothetical protein PHYSODRAFT_519022 [Phytophthora sojae]|eukprot:XP_009534027.1 hypothetical protein PHYSODRAFT_519022 [Phytophthora sojae]